MTTATTTTPDYTIPLCRSWCISHAGADGSTTDETVHRSQGFCEVANPDLTIELSMMAHKNRAPRLQLRVLVTPDIDDCHPPPHVPRMSQCERHPLGRIESRMSSGAPGGHRRAFIDCLRLMLASAIIIGIALFTTGIVSELLWIAAGVLEFVGFRRLWRASRKAG